MLISNTAPFSGFTDTTSSNKLVTLLRLRKAVFLLPLIFGVWYQVAYTPIYIDIITAFVKLLNCTC